MFSAADEIRVSILLGSVASAKAAFEKETKSAVRANAALKGKLEPLADDFRAKTDAFVAKVTALLEEGNGPRPAAADVFATGTDAIAAVSKLYDGYDPLLVDLLDKRASAYRTSNALAVAGTVLSLILVALAGAFVTRGITGQVKNLTVVFDRIEAGDYKTRAAILSQDELGKMRHAINSTLDRTLTLIQSSDEKENIQRSIMKLLEEVSGVADGDLTKDAEVSSDMTGAIADSFN